jgi:hypothetical protein
VNNDHRCGLRDQDAHAIPVELLEIWRSTLQLDIDVTTGRNLQPNHVPDIPDSFNDILPEGHTGVRKCAFDNNLPTDNRLGDQRV